MMGSAFDGEVVSAARAAQRLVADAGLTWADVLAEPALSPLSAAGDDAEILRQVDRIQASGCWLGDREALFLASIRVLAEQHQPLSVRQRSWLAKIDARARIQARAP